MFGKVFGRKSAQKQPASVIPQHPGPDADGVSRVFPQAIFDGEHGEMLRTLGFSPDDPRNFMPTPQLLQARADAAKASQDKFVAEINAQLPGARVIPWALIPWSVWGREPASFLMITCEMFPASPWNTMLLAEDDKSAFILNLPKHPRAGVEGLEDAAVRLLGDLEARHKAVHETVGAALARGDISAIDKFSESKRETMASAVAMGHYFGTTVFGEVAWKRHGDLFGQSLGWRQ